MIVALACVVLVTLTSLVHYEVLALLSSRLPRLPVPSRAKLLVVIHATFLAHAAEIVLYGAAVYALVHWTAAGTLGGAQGAGFMECIYFSAETYTSLGFGDLVPVGSLRLIAGVETLNGLLLIGWSASYTYLAMERFWRSGSRGPEGR